MSPVNVISGGLFPFGGSFGDVLYHILMSLAFVIPLALFLGRAGYARTLAGLTFVHWGFAAVLLWFIAFPKRWTPPEEDA